MHIHINFTCSIVDIMPIHTLTFMPPSSQIRQLLEVECKGGPVLTIRWPNRRKHNCGWGFAQFASEKSAAKAIKMAGKREVSIRGKDVKLRLARPMPPPKNSTVLEQAIKPID